MVEKSNTYVIILAGGMATRLRPLSERIAKPLIDINGEPLIIRIIKSFKKAGFLNFLVLVGYKKDEIKEIIQKEEIETIHFVDQPDQIGMADALQLCLNFLIKNEISLL